MLPTHERAHTHVRTRPKSILGGGGEIVPADFCQVINVAGAHHPDNPRDTVLVEVEVSPSLTAHASLAAVSVAAITL